MIDAVSFQTLFFTLFTLQIVLSAQVPSNQRNGASESLRTTNENHQTPQKPASVGHSSHQIGGEHALSEQQDKNLTPRRIRRNALSSILDYFFWYSDTSTQDPQVPGSTNKPDSEHSTPPWFASSDAYFTEAIRKAEQAAGFVPSEPSTRTEVSTTGTFPTKFGDTETHKVKVTERQTNDEVTIPTRDGLQTVETSKYTSTPQISPHYKPIFKEVRPNELQPKQTEVEEHIIVVEIPEPDRKGVMESAEASKTEQSLPPFDAIPGERKVDTGSTDGEEDTKGEARNGEQEEFYQSTGSSPCRTCGSRRSGSSSEGNTLTQEEVKEMHLKRVINLIKQKLRFNGPSDELGEDSSKVKLPKLPKAVLDETDRINKDIQEEDNFYARDQEAIVAGSDMRRDCVGMRATGCYDFRFNGQVTEEVESATLWLYKTRDRNDHEKHTFIVYELERRRTSQTLRRRNMIARKEMFIKQGWLDLNVTRAVQRWVAKGRDGEMLAIRCKTCHTENHRAIFGAKHDYKPVLIIKFVDKFRHRERRSTSTCNPVTACCKQDLIVTFANISMHTIVRPPTTNLGYCYGFCEDLTSYHSNHTMIRQRWRYQPISPLLRAQLQPCCVPIKLKPITVLDSGDGVIINKVLPNIRVDECGCL